jgi:hypothetical protein
VASTHELVIEPRKGWQPVGERDFVCAPLKILRADYDGTGVMPNRGTLLLQNRWTLVNEPSGVLRES